MSHEIQRRDGLGLQVLDGVSLGKTEHALPFYPLPQKVAERSDIFRRGRGKPQRLSRHGMDKGETPGMEGLTVQLLYPCPCGGVLDAPDSARSAVNPIPYNRITEIRQMDTDLVGPSRFDIDLQKRGDAESFPAAPEGHRRAA